MAEYHVGCGLAGIYAGVLKKNGEEWLHKSLVTKEVFDAVIGYLYIQIPNPKVDNVVAYTAKTKDGKYVRLSLEVSETCPEFAKDVLEGKNT